ncbi:MAG: T9SS type A sorting domain-containing protein [Bacteroidota bacterium]|nr:T9SS type A sorting domain-containing protein [Bacteroidota bacterium]MDP3146484.1 T9SS type A sorting domain-containing protein [Bacteroidota bacterium]
MKKTTTVKLRFIMLLSIILSSIISNAQVVPNIDWVKYYNPRNQVDNSASALDANNNVYTTGYFNNNTNRDLFVQKHDSLGNLLWTYTYDYGGDDAGNAIKVSSIGNVYVTGVSYRSSSGDDFYTIKLNGSGSLQWAVREDGGSNLNDAAIDIKIDEANAFIYVTGTSNNGSNEDIFTVSYKDAAGALNWLYTYDAGDDDIGVGLVLANAGADVIVCGNSKNGSGNMDILAFSLNNSPSVNWSTLTDGTANSDDRAEAIILAGGNFAICGMLNNSSTNDDYTTQLYDASSGSIIWQKDYDVSNGYESATSLVRDSIGNIAVTGYVNNSSIYEYHTILYDSTGTQLWTNIENTGIAGLYIEPRIACDTIAHHFYVAGAKANTSNDASVYQITPTGNTTWRQDYDGSANGHDAATGLVVNGIGVIYLSALGTNTASGFDITTIKISQTPSYFPINLTPTEPHDTKYQFFKNSGQIQTTDFRNADEVVFYTNECAPDVFVKNNSFSFVASRIDTFISLPDTFQRVDVSFVGANPLTRTFKNEKGLTELNYFLPHCGAGIVNVDGNNRLITPNILPNIDLHYYSNTYGLKLYTVAKPFADTSKLVLNITGATNATVTSGQLKISTFKGDLFFKLEVYQLDTSLIPITLTGTPQIVSMGGGNFKMISPAYTPTLPLVFMLSQGTASAAPLHISGIAEWSTPFGGTGEDELKDVKTDLNGNSYWAGFTNSSNNYPSTAGIVLPFLGGYDLMVAVIGSAIDYVTFPPTSAMPEADAIVSKTFYGGSNDDKAFAIAVTGNRANSEIFVTGVTNSSDFGILNQGNPFYQTYNGNNDAFILNLKYTGLKLNPNVTTNKFATYFGGSGDDEAHDIKLVNGNIVIGGKTTSPATANTCTVPTDNGFPVCSAIFSPTNSGGTDGFISIISMSTGLVNSTFIGGDLDDEINEIAGDTNFDIVFVGTSESDGGTLNPVAISGSGKYNQSSNGGNKDVIFGRSSTTGANKWLSFFGGSGNELGKTISIKPNNDFFISGLTESSTPACSSCTCTVPGAGQFPLCPKTGATTFTAMNTLGTNIQEGFISLLKSTGELDWSTYMGGSGGNGFESINSIVYGGIKIETAYDDMTNGLFFGGHTDANIGTSINVSNGAVPNNLSHGNPSIPVTTQAFDGYYGAFKSGLDLKVRSLFLGQFNTPTTYPVDVFSSVNKVHVFKNQLFYAGKTTNPAFKKRLSSGQGGIPPTVHYSPYINSMNWSYNGPATYGTNVNYSADAFMARTSIDNMNMYTSPPTNGLVEQKKSFQTLKLFPNPSNDNLTFELSNFGGKDVTFQVINMLGQIVYSEKVLNKNSEVISHTFNVLNFTNGIYCITIVSGNKTISKTFIKN